MPKVKPATGMEMVRDQNRLSIEFGTEAPQTVLLKYAISYVSQEQAKTELRCGTGCREF